MHTHPSGSIFPSSLSVPSGTVCHYGRYTAAVGQVGRRHRSIAAQAVGQLQWRANVGSAT